MVAAKGAIDIAWAGALESASMPRVLFDEDQPFSQLIDVRLVKNLSERWSPIAPDTYKAKTQGN